MKDLEAEAEKYRGVYLADVSPTEEHVQYGCSSVFVNLGYVRLKLLEPHGQGSAITSLLGPHEWAGVHHVCYKVDEIEQTRDRLTNDGYHALSGDTFKQNPKGNGSCFFVLPRCLDRWLGLRRDSQRCAKDLAMLPSNTAALMNTCAAIL